MVSFGLGSMLGSWLGGKLADKIGFYRVMIFSLFSSGIGFLLLQFVTSFVGLCIGMFSIMVLADMFRPAMFVSLGAYSKPENRTRALKEIEKDSGKKIYTILQLRLHPTILSLKKPLG